MMTLEEIRASKINALVAREAYEQCSQRLNDALATKAGYERKAFALLGGFVALSLALFSAGGAFLAGGPSRLFAPPFIVAGIVYVVGATLFLWALLDDQYGAMGSHPEMWLNKGTIDGGDEVLPAMLGYIVYHHHERIDQSMVANNSKAWKIRAGAVLGALSPLALGIWLTLLG